MPRFHYQAFDRQQQPVEGHVEDVDVKSAATVLEQQGLTITSIRQVGAEASNDSTSSVRGHADSPFPASEVSHPSAAAASGSERQSVQRQIQEVMQRGQKLAPALTAYARELPPGKQRRTLQRLAGQLENGDTVAWGTRLDENLLPLLSASASSGDPTLILRGVVDESQRTGKARRLISSALAYPVLLLLVILLVTSFFSWLIAPVYQEIFNDFAIELPAVTRAILGFHQRVRDSHGLQLLIPAGLLVGAFVYFSFTPAPGRARLLQVLPVVGSLNRLASQSQFCRYLADFVQAEISVADALRISGRNTGHFLLRDEANTLADRLELGTSRDASTLPLRMVPHTAVHVCQSTSNPAAGARILRELAAMYDDRMENRLSFVLHLLEPVFVLVLGIAVGVHFVALLLPLVSLIQNLT